MFYMASLGLMLFANLVDAAQKAADAYAEYVRVVTTPTIISQECCARFVHGDGTHDLDCPRYEK
jgi:hypothetical protein